MLATTKGNKYETTCDLQMMGRLWWIGKERAAHNRSDVQRTIELVIDMMLFLAWFPIADNDDCWTSELLGMLKIKWKKHT
jgi:hypothetical protein